MAPGPPLNFKVKLLAEGGGSKWFLFPPVIWRFCEPSGRSAGEVSNLLMKLAS
jgi:hypothetical protein